MKAIVVTAFGGPDILELRDVADPGAGDGEVLVRVRAAGVNPVDAYVRSGQYAAFAGRPPFVAGTELSGEIVAGPRAGERVFAAQTTGVRNTGAYAELAVVRDAFAFPDHLSFAEAAAIPVAFGTAHRALVDVGGLRAAQTVLVHGASGGVGHAATQLAAALGATVIGTASTAVGRQAVRDAGARHVFDHKPSGHHEHIKAATDGGRGVDLIIEMLANANLDADLDLLAPRGTVVIVGSRGRVEIDPRRTMVKETSVRGMTLWGGGDEGLRRAFAAVGALLARRAITPLVAIELPFAEAGKAQELVMSSAGRAGKVVLRW